MEKVNFYDLNFDQLKSFLIEKGEVVEEGSHASLLAANGRYASLYNNDFEEIKDT